VRCQKKFFRDAGEKWLGTPDLEHEVNIPMTRSRTLLFLARARFVELAVGRGPVG